MKQWTPQAIQDRIKEVLPEGRVVPRHTEDKHFYEVLDGKFPVPPVYPSVTGKLQVLKDEGLMNYKMNRALEYIFANFKQFDDGNIMQHLDEASKITGGILKDAGDVGTRVHDMREKIFRQWIETGMRPDNFLSFIPESEVDFRVHSCIKALETFVIENDYVPVACELLVYSHKLKTAGTLDDLGLMKQYKRKGDPDCDHKNETPFGERDSVLLQDEKGWHRCVKCDAKFRWQFVLMDLKTSNQFKDHYFFQVSIYWWMFKQLTGLAPERCFILKVSKDDRTYSIEEIFRYAKVAQFAQAMIKVNEGVDFIRSLRKDNQKVVAPMMEL